MMARLSYSDTITVYVGRTKTPFVLHKSYATKNSDYFKALTEGQ